MSVMPQVAFQNPGNYGICLHARMQDEIYRRMWEVSMDEMMSKLMNVSTSGLLYVGMIQHDTLFMPRLEHLTCYLPGNLALGAAAGAVNGSKADHYMEVAKNLTYSCWQMYERMPTGLLTATINLLVLAVYCLWRSEHARLARQDLCHANLTRSDLCRLLSPVSSLAACLSVSLYDIAMCVAPDKQRCASCRHAVHAMHFKVYCLTAFILVQSVSGAADFLRSWDVNSLAWQKHRQDAAATNDIYERATYCRLKRHCHRQ